jgi:hypothetical protein
MTDLENLKKQELSLVGPVSLEMLQPYDEIMKDGLCTQKPKRRFTVIHKGTAQTECRDFFIKFTAKNKRIHFIEQISFAPAKYVHYMVKPNQLPTIKRSEAKLIYLGEYTFD